MEVIDKIFNVITYLAYAIADSKYVKQMGASNINPYILLLIVSFIIYLILDILYKLYKKHRYKAQRREEIQNIKWKKDIEKKEELNELKRRRKEADELSRLLEQDTIGRESKGLTLEDIGSLILKQNEELEKVKNQKPQVIIKEVEKKEKPKKEPKEEKEPKPEVKIKPKVKEINITIPKIKITKPEEEIEEPEPIVESVLTKDITSTDNDRIEISEDYQENIEEKVEQLEEVEVKDNFEETIPIESSIEEPKEEQEEEPIEEDNPLELLKRKNAARKAHKEKIEEELKNRA